ncbi:hypothetical protein SAMN05421677_101353 [Halobacillus aidingensis]|uniref:Uncharacterized protein n=1 Tax=Halobacillus aidingensis TaxID=240303 RepID=A0A1H0EZ15_HALAD|nr:hypothetical protein SAMN05421677_101353 [Halobacillus aidingensis]
MNGTTSIEETFFENMYIFLINLLRHSKCHDILLLVALTERPAANGLKK